MRRLVVLPEVGSTNTWLKEQGDFHRAYTGVRALRQTSGRGRLERTWHSGGENDLACSFVMPAPPTALPLVPLVAGMALHGLISRYTDVRIKWPNDLLAEGKKLAGILCEEIPSATGLIVVGVGLNVNSQVFPEEIAAKTTSLALCAGEQFSVQRLWLQLYRSLCRTFRPLEYPLSSNFIARYNKVAYRYVRRAEIATAPLEFKTLLKDGRAVFQTADGGEIILDTAE